MDPTLPQEIDDLMRLAFAQAPAHIKSFLASGRFSAFLGKLRTDESLHIDAIGIVSDTLTMMILGMLEPAELAEKLKTEAGLTDAQVTAVLDLANREVFIPLQEELKNVSRPIQAPAPVVRTQASSAPNVPIVSVPAVATPQVPVVPIPVAPPPPPPPTTSIPTPPVYTPPPAEPTMRTMAHDVEAMKSGTTPNVMPYAIPVATPPQVVAPSIPEKIVPAPIPPPPKTEVPDPSLAAVVTPPRTPVPTHAEVVGTLQKYGVDPYREPVE